MSRKLLNIELNRLSVEDFKKTKKRPLVLVLDNIRSQHNIGSAFRTGDAFLLEKIVLCGISACPPTAEIHKTALGAEDTVEWEYFTDTLDAVTYLRENGYTIISIEQVENSTMLQDFVIKENAKYALVFGNEVKGVQQDVVSISDLCIEIPQEGAKHSFNVSVTIGIVLWEMVRKGL